MRIMKFIFLSCAEYVFFFPVFNCQSDRQTWQYGFALLNADLPPCLKSANP
jgi:hypothetical protein